MLGWAHTSKGKAGQAQSRSAVLPVDALVRISDCLTPAGMGSWIAMGMARCGADVALAGAPPPPSAAVAAVLLLPYAALHLSSPACHRP